MKYILNTLPNDMSINNKKMNTIYRSTISEFCKTK